MGVASYLLGVDIGTSSSKAVLTDASGRIVTSCSIEHKTAMPRPGHFEHDAEGVWWNDFVALCAATLGRSKVAPESVSAIGISAVSPAVVLLDGDGRPLRPGILYGIDTRASAEAEELSSKFGDDGRSPPFTSQSVVPKLLWVQRNEPDVWARTELVLGAEGYLTWRLTGQATLDVYDAAAYAPLFDAERIGWRTDHPELCPVSRLPRLVWGTEVVGHLTDEAAARTGPPGGTPVVAGTADTAAEAISCGLSDDGDLMLMYGTSSFFIFRSDHVSDGGPFVSRQFLEAGTSVVAGGMTISGGFAAWFSNLLDDGPSPSGPESRYDQLMQAASDSTPGASGLVALPYLAGERSPFFDPFARGGFLGLTLRHRQGDLYRAILESIGYGIRRIVEELKADGHTVRRVLAVGGGTRNPLLMQLVSDIVGIDQIMPTPAASAAYGDALRAGVGIGAFTDLRETASLVESEYIVRADPEHAAIYDEIYRIYRDFYSQTASLMRDLSRIDVRTRDQSSEENGSRL